eukprot:55993_1
MHPTLINKSFSFIPSIERISNAVLRYTVSSSHCYFSTSNNLNKIPDHHWSLQRKNAKQYQRNVKLAKAPDINDSIRKDIGKTKSSSQVLNILLQNKETILHSSVYGKAIQKCDKLKDWHSVINIMDTLIHTQNFKPSVVEFNIFFNSMAHANKEKFREQNEKYFDIMINTFKLKPNIITFTTLIKGCRCIGTHHGVQSYCHLAEKYFNLMVNEYKISPTPPVYTEMITVYARSKQAIYKAKSTELFVEYVKKMQAKKIKKDTWVFGAYLSLFTKVGDINGMKHVLSMMDDNKIPFDYAIYGDVLYGFIRAKRPRECLKKFNEFQQQLAVKNLYPNNAMYHRQCSALANIIAVEKNELSFNEKFKIYKELKWVIYIHRLYRHPNMIICILSSIMALYHDRNPSHIVKLFELFVGKGFLGYYGDARRDRCIAIDLHWFPFLQKQFILRYFFGYKLLEYNVDDIDGLEIIIGSDDVSKRFVMEQLSGYDPAVVCTVDTMNGHILLVDKEQLIPYMTDVNNCAKGKLTTPSNDWYFEGHIKYKYELETMNEKNK